MTQNPIPSAARRRRTLAAALTVPVAVLLAAGGCSTGASGSEHPAGTSSTSATTQESAALTIADPWVKAADNGMTAAFGTLTNSSTAEVRIVSARTSVSSSMELHEMVADQDGEMVMRQRKGGFVVPAGGSHELSPGGDHLMFMDVTTPVLPGDEVTVTLTAEDGSTVDFTAPARSYSGANENYQGADDSATNMSGGMDMSGGTGGAASSTTTVTP